MSDQIELLDAPASSTTLTREDLLLLAANQAIERNQRMTSGEGKYRHDHHSELVVACVLLRDELESLYRKNNQEKAA